ncbi:MAG: lipoate--protein ligase [Oscillibacter sp.]|nr:lipoate--protein ligase [Oscillibacter sp.]
MTMRYLETGSQNPFYNLAFEEYVLANRRDGDYLLLWQNENTIVVGQNQNAEAEINRPFVDAHNIRVVRRSTGGGTVYHDLGNLNYSFITDAGDTAELSMQRFTAPVVAALRQLGLDAEASGRNDILVEGKKVSGTAQRVMGGRILHHGTLLFDSDPEMVSGALQVDPEKFRSKGTKSVRSRVGNIRTFLKEDMDLPAFWAYLKEALAQDGMMVDALTEDELAAVSALEQTKYATWEWNFGRSPKYDFTRKRRFDGGSVEAGVQVERGCITAIGFYGDFLSRTSLEPLTEALQGCAMRREDVAAVLGRFALTDFFGGITAEELLSLLFDEN